MQRDLVERAQRGDHDAFAILAGATIGRLDAAAGSRRSAERSAGRGSLVVAIDSEVGRPIGLEPCLPSDDIPGAADRVLSLVQHLG